MTGSYYHRLPSSGDAQRFAASEITASAWGPNLQHGSPPLALLTKVVEERLAGSGQRIGRLCLDILGQMPITELTVTASTPRPGRQISLQAAEFAPASRPQRPAARLSAWALSVSDTAAAVSDRYPPQARTAERPLPDFWWDSAGYLDTLTLRREADEAGARVTWATSNVGLVDDEPTTPLQRLAMVVDTCNGLGSPLNPTEYTFMNTDVTVHLHREPTGSEFALRARVSIGPDGLGVTTSELFDHTGFVGVCAQTVLVRRRTD